MPDDDGYVYQEFFSDENLDEFKNKNVGCFTMLIIIIILICRQKSHIKHIHIIR